MKNLGEEEKKKKDSIEELERRELNCAENLSAASEVELSSCCKNRQEELGRGRTVHGGMIGPSSFFL